MSRGAKWSPFIDNMSNLRRIGRILNSLTFTLWPSTATCQQLLIPGLFCKTWHTSAEVSDQHVYFVCVCVCLYLHVCFQFKPHLHSSLIYWTPCLLRLRTHQAHCRPSAKAGQSAATCQLRFFSWFGTFNWQRSSVREDTLIGCSAKAQNDSTSWWLVFFCRNILFLKCWVIHCHDLVFSQTPCFATSGHSEFHTQTRPTLPPLSSFYDLNRR